MLVTGHKRCDVRSEYLLHERRFLVILITVVEQYRWGRRKKKREKEKSRGKDVYIPLSVIVFSQIQANTEDKDKLFQKSRTIIIGFGAELESFTNQSNSRTFEVLHWWRKQVSV